MSAPGFTPGPWWLHLEEGHAEAGYREFYVRSGEHDLAIIYCDESVMPYEEDRANARLIAAAPDLYAALSRIVEGDNSEAAFQAAVAALGKAGGES